MRRTTPSDASMQAHQTSDSSIRIIHKPSAHLVDSRTALMPHHGAWGRYFGSIQLVWCARPPVLNYQIEPPGRANAHDSSADKPCVFDMHHTKALDAFGRLSHRIHGAWGRYSGSIQPVWCARPPVLNYQIEPPGRANAHDSSADKHCVFDMHHTRALDAFSRLSHRIHGASGRYSGSIQPVWCAQRC